MTKRAVILVFFILIVCSFLVDGEGGSGMEIQAHTADVRWDHSAADSIYVDTVWELSNELLKIDFNLVFGSNQTKNITLTYSGTSQISAPSGSVVGSKIIWTGNFGDVWINATFNGVNQNTNYTWAVDIYDVDNVFSTHNLTLTIKNDSIAPTHTLNSPQNFSIVKKGTVLFNSTIIENESGLNIAKMFYDYYSSISTSSITVNNNLSCGDYCLTTIDLNPPVNQNYFGFFFNLSDKAGNEIVTPYFYLYVDDEAPVVTLNTPADNVNISTHAHNYSYNVTDNAFGIDNQFTPWVNCTIRIDGSDYTNVLNYTNATVNTVENLAGLAGGYYYWNVVCVDTAGWSTTSETRNFMMDTTGPVITLDAPANNSVVKNGTLINLSVNDALSSVDQVWYQNSSGNNLPTISSYSINTSNWREGANDIIVFANDTLGNVGNNSFTFKVDKKGPNIQLISPADNAFGNNNFVVNAADDYSTNLNCDLTVDGIVRNSSATTSGALLGFTINLSDGNYSWNITCTDEVGNSNTSVTWNVMIDTTDPAVSLVSPANNNNTGGIVDFKYDVVESNLANCSLYINGSLETTNLNNSNFTNINLGASNNAHTWYVECYDLAGNSNQSNQLNVYYDNILPNITNVTNSSIDSDSAIISWNVDEVTSNTVYYGTNSSDLSSTVNGATQTATPSITLSLSASTTYFYKAQSCDQFVQCTNSTSYNFTTSSAPFTPSSSGGGSSSSKKEPPNSSNSSESKSTCVVAWECSEWGACVEGKQTRICTDANGCSVDYFKPEEVQECLSAAPEETFEVESSNPPGVGQAIGLFDQIKANWGAILFATIVVAGLALFGWRKRIFGGKGFEPPFAKK